MFDILNPMRNRFKGTTNLAHLWAFDRAFLAAYAKVADVVICSPDRCYVLWQLAKKLSGFSVIAEVGVAAGGTAGLMGLANPKAILYLFDTFEGVPENDEGIPTGTYAHYAYAVEDFLMSRRVTTAILYKGRFEDSIKKGFGVPGKLLKERLYSLVHVDCDLSEPTREAIHYFWPRIIPGGAMVVDDYGINLPQITRIVDGYFFEQVLRFSYAQAVMIKTKNKTLRYE